MTKEEILVAFSTDGSGALGNVWRMTAKKTDFYLDPLGQQDGAFHLSVHGPSPIFPDGHRFHVKVDPKAAASVEQRGDFIAHSIPPAGHAVDGQELKPGVFRVARVRWRWDLQRPRFRQAADTGHPPEMPDAQSRARLSTPLEPNEAADLDLVVSYDEPYWPGGPRSLRDSSRLGPLRNNAGMWLTATSYRRSQVRYPAPERALLPLPGPGEEPNRIMSGAPDAAGEMYWFVEGITSRQLLDASRANAAT